MVVDRNGGTVFEAAWSSEPALRMHFRADGTGLYYQIDAGGGRKQTYFMSLAEKRQFELPLPPGYNHYSADGTCLANAAIVNGGTSIEYYQVSDVSEPRQMWTRLYTDALPYGVAVSPHGELVAVQIQRNSASRAVVELELLTATGEVVGSDDQQGRFAVGLEFLSPELLVAGSTRDLGSSSSGISGRTGGAFVYYIDHSVGE
jgi:hypothetical protein